MKYLIVGLGNPGMKYEETRHNIGFKVVDLFAKQFESKFVADKHADVAEVKFKGRTIVLVKPSTFMNLSGKAVNYWLQKEKVPIENLLVITDDIALPFGKLRMKAKGSDGGHNGLKDISNILGTNEYSRFRFGIGGDFPKGRQSDYVLSKWNNNEIAEFISLETHFIELFKSYLFEGIDITMNKFNG